MPALTILVFTSWRVRIIVIIVFGTEQCSSIDVGAEQKSLWRNMQMKAKVQYRLATVCLMDRRRVKPQSTKTTVVGILDKST